MKINFIDQKKKIKGRVTLLAFEPGIISGLLEEGTRLDDAIKIACRRGKCREKITKDNLVVDSGLELMANLLIGEASPLSYQAIGTGTTTPANADSALTTEVSRHAITDMIVSGSTAILETYFLAANSGFNLKEGGLYGGDATSTPGSGTLFSHYLLSFDNSSGSNDLTFIYELEVER